jgi:hypothetical protein
MRQVQLVRVCHLRSPPLRESAVPLLHDACGPPTDGPQKVLLLVGACLIAAAGAIIGLNLFAFSDQ